MLCRNDSWHCCLLVALLSAALLSALLSAVTDGVDEAMDPDSTLYSKERVREFIRNGSPDPEELGRALLSDVRRHANGRAQNDDITIMAFGRFG